jgi:hypothetical protein
MIFFGTITPSGTLELDHPELYSDLLKGRLANCRIQLDIDRKKTPRSHQQNAYLWAAVYPVIPEIGANLNGVKTKVRTRPVKVQAAITVSPTKRLTRFHVWPWFEHGFPLGKKKSVLTCIVTFSVPVKSRLV